MLNVAFSYVKVVRFAPFSFREARGAFSLPTVQAPVVCIHSVLVFYSGVLGVGSKGPVRGMDKGLGSRPHTNRKPPNKNSTIFFRFCEGNQPFDPKIWPACPCHQSTVTTERALPRMWVTVHEFDVTDL